MPQVDPWLAWVWRAWHGLHADRPHEVAGYAVPMGGVVIRSKPGRIPWGAVRGWCDHYGIGADDMQMLLRLLSEMDEEFIAIWTEKANAA